MVIVSQTLSRPVTINTNRHYDYDIFNRQINIHLEVKHSHWAKKNNMCVYGHPTDPINFYTEFG